MCELNLQFLGPTELDNNSKRASLWNSSCEKINNYLFERHVHHLYLSKKLWLFLML